MFAIWACVHSFSFLVGKYIWSLVFVLWLKGERKAVFFEHMLDDRQGIGTLVSPLRWQGHGCRDSQNPVEKEAPRAITSNPGPRHGGDRASCSCSIAVSPPATQISDFVVQVVSLHVGASSALSWARFPFLVTSYSLLFPGSWLLYLSPSGLILFSIIHFLWNLYFWSLNYGLSRVSEANMAPDSLPASCVSASHHLHSPAVN